MGVTAAPTTSSAPSNNITTSKNAITTGKPAMVDYSAERFPMREEDYKALAKLPGNDHCIDCGSGKEVEWASVSFGILFCAQCSYIHKVVVGAHFRCIKPGTPWTRDNLNRMKLGGNHAFRKYLMSKGIDFANSTMHVRYTCPQAKEYYLLLKHLVDEAKASVAVALKFPSVEGDLHELVTGRSSMESCSLEDSLELDVVIPHPEEMTKSNNNNNSSNGSRSKIFSSLTAKFSKSGRRMRSDTEETSVTSDASNAPVPTPDTTSVTECDTDPEEEDDHEIISRIVTTRRQSIASMDVSVSECVRQCLEENKDEQSILYKWTAKKMTPSVSYMGRSFKVDGATGEFKLEKSNHNRSSSHSTTTTTTGAEGLEASHSEPPSPATPTRPKMDGNTNNNNSFVNRMGFSWRTDASDPDHHHNNNSSLNHNSTNSFFEEEETNDYNQLLRDISDQDFRKLKAALRSKGALTSRCVEGMIYTEAVAACSLPQPKRSSFKSYFSEEPRPRRSRWAPPPHHRHSMFDESTEFGEVLMMESKEGGGGKLGDECVNIMPLTISISPTRDPDECVEYVEEEEQHVEEG